MNNLGLMIDYEYCTGCQSCELACKNEHGYPMDKWGIKVMEFGPYEMEPSKLQWDYIPFPTDYCDMCKDRIAAGGIPSCALHCLANVISWGTPDELAEKMKEKGSRVTMYLP